MTVYLIHFLEPYKHAEHYLGSTNDLEHRLAMHRSGQGARLMEVITQAGIPWKVACVWEGGRDVEKQLKRRHSGKRLCPICIEKGFDHDGGGEDTLLTDDYD
jgi:predicted GIY-YIG superfamily endonuclease